MQPLPLSGKLFIFLEHVTLCVDFARALGIRNQCSSLGNQVFSLSRAKDRPSILEMKMVPEFEMHFSLP